MTQPPTKQALDAAKLATKNLCHYKQGCISESSDIEYLALAFDRFALDYLERENAVFLKSDSAVDDPNNKDWPTEQVAPASQPTDPAWMRSGERPVSRESGVEEAMGVPVARSPSAPGDERSPWIDPDFVTMRRSVNWKTAPQSGDGDAAERVARIIDPSIWLVHDEIKSRGDLAYLEKWKSESRQMGGNWAQSQIKAQAALAAMPAPSISEVMPNINDDYWQFGLGERVTKTKGSQWTGKIVGFYSTELTPKGYAVESENEPGSVQIYPAAALFAPAPEMK